jgi:hypothetical protein
VLAFTRKHVNRDDSLADENGSSAFKSSGKNNNAKGQKSTDKEFSTLPKLDGVTYTNVSGDDGSLWILTKGNTFAQKDILSKPGFKWSPKMNGW